MSTKRPKKPGLAELQALAGALTDLWFVIREDGIIDRFGTQDPADLYTQVVLGQSSVFKLLPKEVAREIHRGITRIRRSGKKSSFSYRLALPEGERFYEAVLSPMEDGRILALVRNVTEKHRADMALRESRVWLDVAIEASGSAPFEWVIPDATVLHSGELARIIGYGANEIGTTAEEWATHVHPGDLAELQGLFAGSHEAWSRMQDQEFRMRHRDGSWRWFQARGRIVGRDEHGYPVRVVGLLTDLTDRKNAAEARQEAERLARDVIECAGEGIIVTDREFRYRIWNRSMETLTGQPAATVLGLPAGRAMASIGGLSIPEVLERLRAGARIAVPESRVFVRPGQEEAWISGSITPLFDSDGDFVGCIAIVQDVTERHRIEETLRAGTAVKLLLAALSTEFVNLGSDEIDQGIREALRDIGEFAHVGRCAVMLIDEVRDTASMTHEWCADGIPERGARLQDVPTSVVPWWFERLRRFEPIVIPRVTELSGEATQLRHVLLLEDIRSSLVVPMVSGGMLIGLLGVDAVGRERDWTDDDLSLLRLAGELFASALARRRSEEALRRAKTDAEAATRAKSAFLANMSHEIRTPINGILGLAGLLLGSELTAPQRDDVRSIHGSARSLLEVLSDILDSSKIEAGKLDLVDTDFDPRGLVGEAIGILAPEALRHGLELGYEVAPEVPPRLRGDPHRIRQVLLNLLSNAVKFTPSGTVSLAVATRPEGAGRARLRLSVTDTGIGIPSDRIGEVFEPFTQADESSTRRYGGTGLGLSITRHLIDLMQGTLTVESRVGEGSVFTAEIPFEESTDQSHAYPGSGDRPNPGDATGGTELLRGHRVLVAEDNEINRTVLIRQLQSWGCDVTPVADGEQALDVFRSGCFDLVLADVQMPRRDGYSLAQAIRAIEATRGTHTPIIALTAHAMPGDRDRCLAAGMDDYAAKPVPPEQLQALVRRWCPAPAAGIAEGASGRSALDPGWLDRNTGGDPAFQRELIHVFRRELPAHLEEIIRALQGGLPGPIARAAHRLKSSCRTLGALDVAEAAEALEMSTESGLTPAPDGPEMRRLRAEHVRLLDFLERREPPSEPTPGVNGTGGSPSTPPASGRTDVDG